MGDWPTWVWVLLIMQFALGAGIYKLEKDVEHLRNLLLHSDEGR